MAAFYRGFQSLFGAVWSGGRRSRGDWRSHFLCLSSGLLLTLRLIFSMLFSMSHTSSPLFLKINLLTRQFAVSKISLVKNSGVYAHYTQVQSIINSFQLANNLGTLCSMPQSLQKLTCLVNAQLWSLQADGFYMRQRRSCLCNLG